MYILTIPALQDDKAVQDLIGAVLALDGTATFEFDVPERKLTLDTVAELEDVKHALDVAGYLVESVEETDGGFTHDAED